jgi:hypothetical protein
MKILTIGLLGLLLTVPVLGDTPQDEKVTVPKSMLTQDQLNKLQGHDLRENVHEWAGVGKEVGEAVNSSLAAVTVQTNSFAQTGVGKLTMVLVVWKILGDQIVHLVGGAIELVVFLPLWIWSYRKTCMVRRIKTGKDTWQTVDYKKDSYGDCSPRQAHLLAIVILMGIFLVTVFSY